MLPTSFFKRDVLTVARELIGVELVWKGCSGIIVETEAYAAEGDEACHTMHRPSAREFVRVMPPGAAYVYFNYGMYWMFNLLAKGGSQDGLILVRALEPVRGIELMRALRGKEAERDLCSGPGKLCQALGIVGSDHGTPMTGSSRPKNCGLRIPKSGVAHEVITDVRVGISKAVEHPWRFLAAEHPLVSVAHGRVKVMRPRPKGRNGAKG